MLHQINHATSTVGVNIGADNSLGLVQHDVHMRIRATYDAAIHFNLVLVRVHPSRQRVNDDAVHAHARLRHQFFALAATGHASLRQNFLYALTSTVVGEWMRGA